jgi:hypothetical protein
LPPKEQRSDSEGDVKVASATGETFLYCRDHTEIALPASVRFRLEFNASFARSRRETGEREDRDFNLTKSGRIGGQIGKSIAISVGGHAVAETGECPIPSVHDSQTKLLVHRIH